MKVKKIIARALKCKTEENAKKLLETMEKAFSKTSALGHLYSCNSGAEMEDDQNPFINFELNHEISEHYITMIRPEIRGGKFTISVITNRMLDGLGMQSQSWEVENGMEDIIEVEHADITIEALAQEAKSLAIMNHAKLIERVGVNHSIALETAEKSW